MTGTLSCLLILLAHCIETDTILENANYTEIWHTCVYLNNILVIPTRWFLHVCIDWYYKYATWQPLSFGSTFKYLSTG